MQRFRYRIYSSRPLEGLAAGIVVSEKLVDALDQLLCAGERSAINSDFGLPVFIAGSPVLRYRNCKQDLCQLFTACRLVMRDFFCFFVGLIRLTSSFG